MDSMEDQKDETALRLLILDRTVSGFPLCSICRSALGSCEHTHHILFDSTPSLEGIQEEDEEQEQEGEQEEQEEQEEEQTSEKVIHEDLCKAVPNYHKNDSNALCYGCYETPEYVIEFSCPQGKASSSVDIPTPHVQCLDCFSLYAASRINDRKLVIDQKTGEYTIPCFLASCGGSVAPPSSLKTILKFLGKQELEDKYERFSAIQLCDDFDVIWCNKCGHGLLLKETQSSSTTETTETSSSASENKEGDGEGKEEEEEEDMRVNIKRPLDCCSEASSPSSSLKRRRTRDLIAPSLSSSCMKCLCCEDWICTVCRNNHAPSLSCQAFRSKEREKESAHLNETEVTEATTKECPQCHVPIFKDGGCNHMTVCFHCFPPPFFVLLSAFVDTLFSFPIFSVLNVPLSFVGTI